MKPRLIPFLLVLLTCAFLVKQMNWVELEKQVGLLSRFLAGIPAMERGDRLGVLGRNSVEYLQVNTRVTAALVRTAVSTCWLCTLETKSFLGCLQETISCGYCCCII